VDGDEGEQHVEGTQHVEGKQHGALDVIRWSAEGGVQVLANLSNAHAPVIPTSNLQLGYVDDAVSGSTYGAMTVATHPSLVPGLQDKWSVTTLDLTSGKLTQAALAPQPSLEGAETTALCGFGLVAPPSRTGGPPSRVGPPPVGRTHAM